MHKKCNVKVQIIFKNNFNYFNFFKKFLSLKNGDKKNVKMFFMQQLHIFIKKSLSKILLFVTLFFYLSSLAGLNFTLSDACFLISSSMAA